MPQFTFGDRAYCYEGLPLPAQIGVGGCPLFVSRPRLVVGGEGEEPVPVVPGEPLFLGKTEHAESWSFSGLSEGANLIYNAEVRAEDDGFIWCDLVLVPRQYAVPSFRSFWLEFPLRAEICELINTAGLDIPLPEWANGYMPEEGGALPFVPSLWIGREDAGFCITMESARGTVLSDEGRMFELIPGEGELLLRMRLLDALPAGWEHDSPPVELSFGILATPVKEFALPEGMERALHVQMESLSNPLFDDLPEQGVKYVVFHENWTAVQNYGLPADGDEIRRQVERCHRMGMKTLAYFGFEYATNAPGFARNWDQWLVKAPNGRLRGGYERHNPPQRDFVVCYRSGYADVLRERVRAALEDYGFDGIYTDGTLMVFPCSNEKHGCGWRDARGELHPTYPVLAWRALLRDLYGTARAHGGVFDSHNGGCCFPALYSFTDTILDGEAAQEIVYADVAGFLSSGTVRSQFTGRNLGVPVEFVIYHEELVDPLLLCGIPSRFFSFEGVARAAGFWKRMDVFGAGEAEFHPVWDGNNPLTADDAAIRCACWIRTAADGKQRTLAVAYNPTDTPRMVVLSCPSGTARAEIQPGTAVMLEIG